jgi:hypothetical protein
MPPAPIHSIPRFDMPRLAVALIGAILAALIALPCAALATTPGHWDPVTAADGENIDQVATLRTPDAQLHVIWHRKTPGNSANADLMQTVIAPNGTVGAPQALATNWAGIGDPAIVRASDGQVLVLAAAQRSTDSSDPIQNVALWSSSDSGASWTLTPADVATGAGFSDPMGAAIGPDGATPFFAWSTTFGLFVHRGTDPSAASANFHDAAGLGCCGYHPGLALDSAGQLVVGWYALVSQGNGVYAQQVDPSTGNPTGSLMRMPGTGDSVSPDQRVGVVARPGKPGVFLVYGGGGVNATKVLLWRFGAPASTELAGGAATLRDPAIAATPDGRLWVAWTSKNRVYARRSNPAVTRWGATTSIAAQKGAGTVFKVALDAQAGALDVFGAFAPTGGSTVQTWHTQMQPGLTLIASPSKLKAGGSPHKVTLKVTDAGSPVKGATVKLGGKSAKTGVAGTASLSLGPFRQAQLLGARATKAGYVAASTSVRVRR